MWWDRGSASLPPLAVYVNLAERVCVCLHDRLTRYEYRTVLEYSGPGSYTTRVLEQRKVFCLRYSSGLLLEHCKDWKISAA
jgi:hypothetical protein